jgi:hypothetical protein
MNAMKQLMTTKEKKDAESTATMQLQYKNKYVQTGAISVV